MRKFLPILVVLVFGVVLAGCTNKNLIAQKDMEISNMDRQIIELEREIDELKHETGTERNRVDELNRDLREALGDLQEKEKLWLKDKEGMSTITMPNTATFASGSTRLTEEGQEIIDTIWSVLQKYPDREILIEGHTDNVPIATEFTNRFTTNWELSAARALAVLHYVCERHKADPERLSAVGCGEHRPVAGNTTEEGRSQNRRVVIVIRGRA